MKSEKHGCEQHPGDPQFDSGRRDSNMQTKLTCPKCGKTFDYNFIPGVSFTAIRLGNFRYMVCPLCGKAAMFNVVKNLSHGQKKSLGLFNIAAVFITIALAGIMEFNAFTHNLPDIKILGFVLFAIGLAMLIPVFHLTKSITSK